MKLAWNKGREIARGEKFGAWTVLGKSFVMASKTCALCKCRCGAEKVIVARYLLNGIAVRCHKCAVGTHGQTSSPTWRSWQSMHTRCNNPNCDQYHLYGARGIKICEEWHSFERFLSDMGKRPSGMTIDRIDTDGDYTKENCRWATAKTQAENRRSTRWVEYEGNRYSATDLAKHLNISYSAIIGRLNRGAKLDDPIDEKKARGGRKHKSTGADCS